MPVQVEFEHFAVVTACDPPHYQLLCCEDDDEFYTMRPAVGCKLRFTVRDDISWCAFNSDNFARIVYFMAVKTLESTELLHSI